MNGNIRNTIAVARVSSKLDHCNSLFLMINTAQITLLGYIQNAVAHAITRNPEYHHITLVLRSLQLV